MQTANNSNNKKSARKQSHLSDQHGFSSSKKPKNLFKTDTLLESKEKQADKENCLDSSNQIQDCLLHSKPADLICLTDGAIICSNCALFGNHRGHEVINMEGMIATITQATQKCLDLYSQLQENWKKYGNSFLRQKCMKELKQKKNSLEDEIDFYYQNIFKSLEQEQQKSKKMITEWYEQECCLFQNQLNQQNEEQLERGYERWCQQLSELAKVIQFTPLKIQELVKALPLIEKRDNGQIQLFYEGDSLMNQRINRSQQILMEIQKNCEAMKLSFQYFDFQKCVCIQKMKDVTPVVPEKIEEDNLLISIARSTNIPHYPISVIPPKRQMFAPIAQEIYFDNIPHLSISDIQPGTFISSNLSSDRSEQTNAVQKVAKEETKQTSERKNIENVAQESETNRKKKKCLGVQDIPLAEKYRGVLDDLKNDRVETIDFTNAEITDAHIWVICFYISKSEKLKLIKLIKNKLSDASMQEIIRSALNRSSSPISLNLTQNYFTDKSISIIEKSLNGYSKENLHIKSITLTMNKINRRTVKNKIDELNRRLGISIII